MLKLCHLSSAHDDQSRADVYRPAFFDDESVRRRDSVQVVTLIFGRVFISCRAFVVSVGGPFMHFTSKDLWHLAICSVNCKLTTVNLVKASLTTKTSAG